MLFHSGVDARHFILPPPARTVAWRLFVDTGAESPADVYPDLDGPPPPANGIVTLQPRSLMVYTAIDKSAPMAEER
jgi:glycogen operon protein